MTSLPPVPNPPPPNVQRITPDGKPTTATVVYEKQLTVFLRAVKAAIEGP